ncbi:MAG: M48 family metallopeptidase [Bacteroidales bacterium]|jgi:STE24 endopeptidase|nr:M48 family metallopeptidase [Bacteroidales bacterium]
MTPSTIFIIILTIICADFLLKNWLTLLNLTGLSAALPPELSDVYDGEKYLQSQRYERVSTRFGLIVSFFNLIVILLMLSLGGFAAVDRLAASVSGHFILHPLIFFAILVFGLELMNMPFSVYSTFVIEEKFGFNKTTRSLFVADTLKNILLTAVFGGGILALIIWFYGFTAEWFWVWAWGLASAFMLFMAVFYSSLIVPLFNKQTLLEDGELKDAITQYSDRAGFHLDRIYTIDGSKRSTKANAYFSGLGRKKRIVLFDTLIKELTLDEIVAVLLHEIGHYKKKHVITSIILSIIQTGITLFILSLFISQPALSQALGATGACFHIGLIAFGILYNPISVIVGLGLNVLSRKHEYQADTFAARFGMARGLISALKKLSRNNLSNLTPHPFYVFFHYSHPALLQRIRALNQYLQDNKFGQSSSQATII